MSPAAQALHRRLASGRALVLDGATGTELERRGVATGLPLWSAHALVQAPQLLGAIHRDYARAGADILTANTFRTQRRTLRHGGRRLAARDRELTAMALALARGAADAATPRRPLWVAGSAPPLADCYRPDLAPRAPALRREHQRHADNLAGAGADLVLIETMNTLREALAALHAAHAAGLPALVSFVCWRPGRLLSGEPLSAALAALARLPVPPLAVAVNCLPPSAVTGCLGALAAAGLPFGVYANLGEPEARMGFRRSEDCTPLEFAARARGWLRAGARLIGGCCGTTPAHIAALARAARQTLPPSRSVMLYARQPEPGQCTIGEYPHCC